MKFFLVPEPFPEPHDIKIASDKYAYTLKLKQQPYASLTEIHFESENEKPLKLKISLDEEKESSHVQLTYNLSYAKSVREIVEVVEIFNAFIDGNGYLMGERIPSNVIPDEPKDKFDKHTLDFWKKVLQGIRQTCSTHYTSCAATHLLHQCSAGRAGCKKPAIPDGTLQCQCDVGCLHAQQL